MSFCISACAASDDRSRLVSELPSDGYALFRVRPGGAERVAVLVELRDVTEGNFVLLYTPSAPRSAGWFELDAGQFSPCRHYGTDAADAVELDCIVPDGRGAIVDAVVARASEEGSQTILRHQLGARHEEERASTTTKKAAPAGWYALMRVARDGEPIPIAIEVTAMDETEPLDPPTVERIE